jgi:hypothetical protein
MIAAAIKIRPVKITDSKKLAAFFDEVDVPVIPEFIDNSQPMGLTSLFVKVHSYFPLGLKSLQEGYVAVENNNILGLISLIPDSKVKHRWKIDQLYLKPNAYDVGKLLIDFIVNKYGAEGVETFMTEIDSMNNDAAAMFKNACGFRFCTYNHIYKLTLTGNTGSEISINDFRKATSTDNEKLHDLYLECLKPQVKVSLEKTPKDFASGLENNIKEFITGLSKDQWILESPESDIAAAYAKISTFDNQTFYLILYTSLPYADYYADILDFMIRYAGLKNKHATLYLSVCEAIQSHSKLLEVLKENDFEPVQTNAILVKDYWRPLKERKPLATPQMIMFPEGTSTAYNQAGVVEK